MSGIVWERQPRPTGVCLAGNKLEVGVASGGPWRRVAAGSWSHAAKVGRQFEEVVVVSGVVWERQPRPTGVCLAGNKLEVGVASGGPRRRVAAGSWSHTAKVGRQSK